MAKIKDCNYPSMLKKHIDKYAYMIKIAQASSEDIRTIAGVKTTLFGPQSWSYINRVMNQINSGLINIGTGQMLGSQPLNFQATIRNPSALTRYSGGLKSLFTMSQELWKIVSSTTINQYSISESINIINNYISRINNLEFPDVKSQSIKNNVLIILNDWLSILK